MAFGNSYGYQPSNYYYPQYPNQIQMPTNGQNLANASNNGIIWVQGEAGAKSYLVGPNTTVQLWDSEAQVIYLKSADASGMPSIKVLDYTIRDASGQGPQVVEQAANYATIEEVEALRKQIDTLTKKIKALAKEDKSNE